MSSPCRAFPSILRGSSRCSLISSATLLSSRREGGALSSMSSASDLTCASRSATRVCGNSDRPAGVRVRALRAGPRRSAWDGAGALYLEVHRGRARRSDLGREQARPRKHFPLHASGFRGRSVKGTTGSLPTGSSRVLATDERDPVRQPCERVSRDPPASQGSGGSRPRARAVDPPRARTQSTRSPGRAPTGSKEP